MRVLAVDTSTDTAGVAIAQDGRIIADCSMKGRHFHSVRLTPMINDILKDTGLCPADIDCFAAALGPGSFTGLRIGIATVKAMAYALSKTVAGVGTLEALACGVSRMLPDDSVICPIMDARNMQVYTAVFRLRNGLPPVKIAGDQAVHISEIPRTLRAIGSDTVYAFTGDACDMHRSYLENELGQACVFPDSRRALNTASCVALIAYGKVLAGEVSQSFDLVPFYLRKPQAERLWKK